MKMWTLPILGSYSTIFSNLMKYHSLLIIFLESGNKKTTTSFIRHFLHNNWMTCSFLNSPQSAPSPLRRFQPTPIDPAMPFLEPVSGAHVL